MRLGLVSALLLAVLAVIFALQNPQPMEVNLLVFQTDGSTALVLILTFAFGVLVGLVSTLPGRLRARRKVKDLERQLDRSPSSSESTPPSSARDPSSLDSADSAS